MDIINEYLERTRSVQQLWNGATIENNRPRVKCADGFEISVQASHCHYCDPREDGAAVYETVELGYPNMEEPLIIDYAEEPDGPLGTVYGYVPVSIVCELVSKHGGIIN